MFMTIFAKKCYAKGSSEPKEFHFRKKMFYSSHVHYTYYIIVCVCNALNCRPIINYVL